MKKIWNQVRSKVSPTNKKPITVVGTVTPIAWDRNGKAKTFSIYTHDEEDLIIENSSLNHKLCLLLNRTVEATGNLYINKEGEKCMRLDKVRGIRGPSSPAPASAYPKPNNWYEEYSINIPRDVTVLSDNEPFDQIWEAC